MRTPQILPNQQTLSNVLCPQISAPRLYSLAITLQWIEQLPEERDGQFRLTRLAEKIRRYFLDVSDRLVANQRTEGCWDEHWWTIEKEQAAKIRGHDLSNQIRATGHLLEWCAVTPPHLRPDDQALARAVMFLDSLLRRPEYYAEKHLLEGTHAFSALVLLDPKYGVKSD